MILILDKGENNAFRRVEEDPSGPHTVKGKVSILVSPAGATVNYDMDRVAGVE